MENNKYRDAECKLCEWRWTWEGETACPECESKRWTFLPESQAKKTKRLAQIEEEKTYR
jgi:uncharacterized Zn finger protein (UPF0148 family)